MKTLAAILAVGMAMIGLALVLLSDERPLGMVVLCFAGVVAAIVAVNHDASRKPA
jgi:F0F1-type ATP synthase assembly protein I